ncbi:hypothetical protein OG292_27115 [Streptomyces sp. NBC_01511]|uniref:hypothetical protein n=1 Tax=Streptomyces sp. NBC_01511 TaxID=2903889 RepID=UPI00386D9C77
MTANLEAANRAQQVIDGLRAGLEQARERLDVIDACATAWLRPDMSEPCHAAGRHLKTLLCVTAAGSGGQAEEGAQS